jgi:hypothetical protein
VAGGVGGRRGGGRGEGACGRKHTTKTIMRVMSWVKREDARGFRCCIRW